VIIERDRRTNERIDRGGGGATSVAIHSAETLGERHRASRERKKKKKTID
jgi:hypothetical protein